MSPPILSFFKYFLFSYDPKSVVIRLIENFCRISAVMQSLSENFFVLGVRGFCNVMACTLSSKMVERTLSRFLPNSPKPANCPPPPPF